MLDFIIPICIALLIYIILNTKIFSERLNLKKVNIDSTKYLMYALLFVLFFYKQIIKLEPISSTCSIIVISYFLYKSYRKHKSSNI